MNITTQIQKGLRHPDKIYKAAVHKAKEIFFWNYYYAALRPPKIKSAVPHDPAIQEEVVGKLKENNFKLVNFKIDLNDYNKYMNMAGYNRFFNYYGGGKAKNFAEKSLEHYLAAKLLDLSKDDIYIDVASSDSPASEVYSKLYGCKAYRQDIIFTKGIHGNTIGGDATNMPICDDFATKMALHCSFEHFEQDADIKFIREVRRVLKKNGKLCILPLYLFNRYAIQTDPAVLPLGGIPFENDAVLYCARGWQLRHGRFYDVPHFISRVQNNLDGLKLTIYVVENEKDISTFCWVKFIALFEK